MVDRDPLVRLSAVTEHGALTVAGRGVTAGIRGLATFAKSKPIGALSAALVVALVLMAVLAPLIAPFDPNATRTGPSFDAPSWNNLFGTDRFGRDVLSRIIWGGRSSLTVGVTSVLLGTVIGAGFGVVSGYFGGRTDILIQRVVDALMAFPTLVLALAVVAVLGSSTLILIITIAIVVSPLASRVARGSALSVKQEVYVEAARALGATAPRILGRHILPNLMAPLIVILSVQIGFAILIAASLAFLGLGGSPTDVAWGSMLSVEGRQDMQVAPWLGIFPGLFLSFTILSFNMLGDAIRDVLDPRLRGGTAK